MKDVFSCDDVCVIVMFQMESVKYNFVKPFSLHEDSVNDKKREALVPTVSLPFTISLYASIINQSCDRLILISRCALISSLHIHKHLMFLCPIGRWNIFLVFDFLLNLDLK